jgi:hypothetical protein
MARGVPRTGDHFQGLPCSRTPAPTVVFSAAPARTAVTKDVTPAPLPVTEITPPSSPSAAEHARASWWVDRLPPPTDRVITLQRLTI